MMTPSDMTGRAALVTGAAAGLGQASAIRLAEVGADVAIVDIAEAGLEQTAQAIRALGRKALVLPLDLSQRANCRMAVERTVAEFGRLDALCNVAGVMIPGLLLDGSVLLRTGCGIQHATGSAPDTAQIVHGHNPDRNRSYRNRQTASQVRCCNMSCRLQVSHHPPARS